MTVLLLAGVGFAACGALVRAAVRAAARGRARGLGAPASWLPRRAREPLAGALVRADLQLGPEEAVQLAVMTLAVAALVAGALSPVLVVPTVLAGAAGMVVALRLGRTRGDRKVAAAVPAGLDRVAAGLRSGGTVTDAVATLAATGGPLAADLTRIGARTRLGAGMVDALEHWPRDRPLPSVRAAAGALAVAAGIGGAAAEALEGLAASLRAEAAALGDARALSAQARVSAVVVGAAPLGYLAFATATDPTSLRVLVGTGVGRICLLAGLGLEALAALWMRALLGPSR
jgi:tight adherence protein B